jgi:hypothetical protein
MDVADLQTDPLTGQIDLDLINTGAGSATRRIRGDLKREVCPSFHIPGHAFPPPLHYIRLHSSSSAQSLSYVGKTSG